MEPYKPSSTRILGRLVIMYFITDLLSTAYIALLFCLHLLKNPSDGYLFGYVLIMFVGYIPYALVIFLPLSVSIIYFITKKGGKINNSQLIWPGIVNCLITLSIALLFYKSQRGTFLPDGASSLLNLYFPLCLWTLAYMFLFRLFFPEFFFGVREKFSNPVS